MRVIDCDCGTTLQAANDDELARAVREHVEQDHPDMDLGEDGAEKLVADRAYSAMDS